MKNRIRFLLPCVFGIILAVSFLQSVLRLAEKASIFHAFFPRAEKKVEDSGEERPRISVLKQEEKRRRPSTPWEKWVKFHHSAKNELGGRFSIVGERGFTALDVWLSRSFSGKLRSKQVVEGKQGWLFYKSPVYDGDTIADYTGEMRFPATFCEEARDSLSAAARYFSETGVEFCFTVAPNKSNIYPELMPERFWRKSDISRTDDLLAFMESSSSVPVADPKRALISAKELCPVYCALDTHWNSVGAYIAVQCVLARLGRHAEDVSTRELEQSFPKMSNDLARLSRAVDLVGKSSVEWTVAGLPPMQEMASPAKIRINENSAARTPDTLLLIGDSFRTRMIPSFLEEFARVVDVPRARCTNLPALLEDYQPATVVLEFAERNVEDIAFNLKMMGF